MNKRVLITGASGFIGKYCIPPLLERGFEVHALSRKIPATDPGSVHWHACDLLAQTDLAALLEEMQPSHLLHLAWYVEHGKYWGAPENYPWVEASLRLAAAFSLAGGKRIVAAGTCAECFPDDHSLRQTPYVQCKLEVKNRLQSMANQKGMGFSWGRIFFPFGPHQAPSRLLPLAIQALAAGRKFPSPSGEDLWDFIYVKDAGAAFAAMVAGEARGDFDVGTGQLSSVRQVLEAVARLMGKESLLEFTPSANPLRNVAADAARFERELGWKADTSLEMALQETIAFWEKTQPSSAKF